MRVRGWGGGEEKEKARKEGRAGLGEVKWKGGSWERKA